MNRGNFCRLNLVSCKSLRAPNKTFNCHVVLILAVIPAWPYSSGWGYYPGGILAVALVLVILLLLLGIL
jgi:hypothetical protein